MRIARVFLMSTIVLFLSVFLVAGNVSAIGLGTEITIYDRNSDGNSYHGTDEDGEVEPGMQHGQKWDLEGFFKTASKLQMVGGYNFKDGEAGYTSGDIFFDVDGDAEFGAVNDPGTAGNQTVMDTFGYDYAIDLDFLSGPNMMGNYGFKLYQYSSEAGGSQTVTTKYAQNQGSNPWEIVDTTWTLIDSGEFAYYTGLTDAEVGFDGEGATHNAVELLGLNDTGKFGNFFNEFQYVHFTMECGNDNLIGTTVVPEPATMLLFGTGLLGLAAISRRKIKIG